MPNENLFEQSIKLFLIKWRNKSASIDEFLDYFKKWCSGRSSGWYEGFDINAPSTSNAIESTHKHIKNDKDLVVKKPLRQFLPCVSSGLVHNWSMKYNADENPNVLEISSSPTISNKDWLEAFDWNQNDTYSTSE